MISYRFSLGDGERVDFSIDPDRGARSERSSPSPADWTKLEFCQCRNCPLSSRDHTYCPAALDIQQAAERFKEVISYARVKVEVETPSRNYSKECDAQTGLQSLIGLLMATSACPLTARLKALAVFHLPFASPEETLFRTVGAHLLRQYFRRKNGQPMDLDLQELDQFYAELEVLNEHFMKRILAASEKDCNMNAVYVLMGIGLSVRFSLEENLDVLAAQFN
jgi:hypothetical protein